MDYSAAIRLGSPYGLSQSAEEALLSHSSFYSRTCLLLSSTQLNTPITECSELFKQSSRSFNQLTHCLEASGVWDRHGINTLCIKRKAMTDAVEQLFGAFPVKDEDKFLFYMEMFWATQRVFFTDLITLHSKLMTIKKQLSEWDL